MIRSIIIGLFVIFFSLSAIVTFKALKLPVYATAYQDYRSEIVPMPVPPVPAPTPEPTTDAFNNSSEDQDTNKALVGGVEKAITQFENQLATTESAIKDNKTVDTKSQSRTLQYLMAKHFVPDRMLSKMSLTPRLKI